MDRYPDPSKVVYPSTQPPPFTCQLTTQAAGRVAPMHTHGTWLDGEGNGNTDVAAGHFHRVRGGVVQPDQSDGHTHAITMLPCGASGVRNISRDGQMIQLGADGQPVSSMVMPPSKRISPWVWGIGAVVIVGVVVGAVMLLRDE